MNKEQVFKKMKQKKTVKLTAKPHLVIILLECNSLYVYIKWVGQIRLPKVEESQDLLDLGYLNCCRLL